MVRILGLFGLIFFLVPREFIGIIYGEKWLATAPALQVLCLYAILRPVFENIKQLYYALGKVGLIVKIRLMQLIVFIACLIILVKKYEFVGAAWAIEMNIITGVGLGLFFVSHLLNLQLTKIFVVPFFSFLITSLTFKYIFSFYLIPQIGTISQLVLAVFFITVIYSFLILILEFKELKEGYELFRGR